MARCRMSTTLNEASPFWMGPPSLRVVKYGERSELEENENIGRGGCSG